MAFLLSVPGRLARFIALSRQERRAIYWGWWQTTKKEAYHYWVRASPALPVHMRRMRLPYVTG